MSKDISDKQAEATNLRIMLERSKHRSGTPAYEAVKQRYEALKQEIKQHYKDNHVRV